MLVRRLLSTAEAATYCGLKTTGALRKARLEGRLVAAGRRGGAGTWTWDVADLERFLRGVSMGLKKRANLVKTAGHPQISSPSETPSS
ncbi:MAG TPA: hypothetical protein VH256_04370 [Thermoleophilaceae bacterium]|nr:hypothetical protein [Thermoleophilaceae bacterium]